MKQNGKSISEMQALQLILIALKIMGYIKGGWMLVLLPTWISLFCMTIINFIKIRKGKKDYDD